jgi:hypothetical protein
MSINEKDYINELLLKNLSFYEPMTFEKILLDINENDLKLLPNFNFNDMHKELVKLKKFNKIKEVKLDKDKAWIKIFPRTNFTILEKLKNLFRF